MSCSSLPVCLRIPVRKIIIIGILFCLLIAPVAAAASSVHAMSTTAAQGAAGTTVELQITACTAPCVCLTPAEAAAKWGLSYIRCSPAACLYLADVSGARTAKYCFREGPAVSAPTQTSITAVSRTTTPVTVVAGTLPVVTTTPLPLRTVASPVQSGSGSDPRPDTSGCNAGDGAGDGCTGVLATRCPAISIPGGNSTAADPDNGTAGNYSPDSEPNLGTLKVNAGHVEFKSPLPDWINAVFSMLFGGR